ncbi:MAG: hypothetical protein MJ072_01820, partial [Clostridia bacterium]|nr:hypothetical protein [Clostridia bacterium]
MEGFAVFLSEVLGQFFGNLWKVIYEAVTHILWALNVADYVMIFKQNSGEFTTLGWILAILVMLLLVGIIVGVVALIVVLIKKSAKVREVRKNSAALINEVQVLNGQVIRLTKEKDRLLALKMGANVGPGFFLTDGGEEKAENEEGAEQESESVLKDGESRFFKLTQVDQLVESGEMVTPTFDNEITLEEICERFRNYACSRMGLYYDMRIIRLYLAAMSSTRLIILQGISGTGKTSLPYAWGKFMENDSLIASVQPSWRDRSELFGYFNEFTKRFSETETLKRMYEATYNEKVY